MIRPRFLSEWIHRHFTAPGQAREWLDAVMTVAVAVLLNLVLLVVLMISLITPSCDRLSDADIRDDFHKHRSEYEAMRQMVQGHPKELVVEEGGAFGTDDGSGEWRFFSSTGQDTWQQKHGGAQLTLDDALAAVNLSRRRYVELVRLLRVVCAKEVRSGSLNGEIVFHVSGGHPLENTVRSIVYRPSDFRDQTRLDGDWYQCRR